MAKDEDAESKVLQEMFEEIMKMIRAKQIKLESIMQRITEQETISEETFLRIYSTLTEYGKKKQWL